MAKKGTKYFCKECGYESSGWLGRCPGCQEWNTFVEAPSSNPKVKSQHQSWLETATMTSGEQGKVLGLDKVETQDSVRLATGDLELDRTLGGGIVKGSLLLVGGEPGIGKSTLLLQIVGALQKQGKSLYISGEESATQIKLRADRLDLQQDKIQLLCETNFEKIILEIEKEGAKFIVIDSIQTIYSEELHAAPGSISQVREVTAGFLRYSKSKGVTIVLLGHVTKDGAIAGPRILEHMVDTVLYFEGEKNQQYRLLRVVKNRFGATNELGIFEMTEKGLIGVAGANAFIEGRPLDIAGAVITSCMEGTRALLLEIQALVNSSGYATPLRTTQGIDRMRLSMLLAVLEKKTGLGLGNLDVFINVVGGIKINETAVDLAVILAVISSIKDKPIKADTIVFGEVGLTGEIRAVSQADRRVQDAYRLGFKSFILPTSCQKVLKNSKIAEDVKLYYVNQLSEAVDIIFSAKT